MRSTRSVLLLFALTAPGVVAQNSDTSVPMPYEIVEGWAKPFASEGFAWGGNSGIYVESPDRIIVLQRGETRLPDPVPAGFRGFMGSIGHNTLRMEGRTWQNVIFEMDRDGNVTEVHCTYDPETAGGNAPDGRKVKATIHWVSADHAVDAQVALYDRLFSAEVPGAETGDPFDDLDRGSLELLTDCKLEPALADTPLGEVVQFERLGYFAHDPRTPMLFHRTVGLRDEWANIQKRQQQGR